MVDAIHVRLAVSACDRCPVAALSRETAVENVRVDTGTERVEFVTDELPEDVPPELELVEFGGRAHGRYDLPEPAAADGGVAANRAVAASGGGGSVAVAGGGGVVTEPPPSASEGPDGGACGGCSCGGLGEAFAGFPVAPHDARIDDGELVVSFVLTGHEELKTVVDGFEAAGLAVELRRLLADRGGGDDGPDVVPIDLTGVTARQAEVARTAAEQGYFDADGASAAEIAAELDLAKSTVSEHLRLVTAELFSQLFDGST